MNLNRTDDALLSSISTDPPTSPPLPFSIFNHVSLWIPS